MSPKISVIITARSTGRVSAIRSVQAHDGLSEQDVEILVATGDNPSRQRNLAASAARGDYLYFLDDDSEPVPGSLKELVLTFQEYEHIIGVGGPATIRDDASFFERATWLAMSSYFGQARMSQRFRKSGDIRNGTEEMLIACNFAVRRQAWLSTNQYFDERLYPNEENELINRMRQQGASFLFHPDIVVKRDFSRDCSELVRKFYRYGQSRILHYKLQPRFIRPQPLLPAIWFAYLCSLIACSRAHVILGAVSQEYMWLPFAIYFICALGSAVLVTTQVSVRRLQMGVTVFGIYWIMHMAYGLGAVVGLFSHVSPRRAVDKGIALSSWPASIISRC